MYITLTNFRFKGAAEMAKGIEYLEKVFIPNQASHFGYISHILAKGVSDDLFLMIRYKVKENRYGKSVDPEGFKAFVQLLTAPPATVGGPNRAHMGFQGLAKTTDGEAIAS